MLGRHTALGDALVTAEVLLRLISLVPAKEDYWKQLSSILFEIQKDKESLAVLALADRQGFLDTEGELLHRRGPAHTPLDTATGQHVDIRPTEDPVEPGPVGAAGVPGDTQGVAQLEVVAALDEDRSRSDAGADSVAIDPHKMGYAPYPAGAFLLRKIYRDMFQWQQDGTSTLLQKAQAIDDMVQNDPQNMQPPTERTLFGNPGSSMSIRARSVW